MQRTKTWVADTYSFMLDSGKGGEREREWAHPQERESTQRIRRREKGMGQWKQGGERNMVNTGSSTGQNQDSTGQNSNIHLLRTSFVIAKWRSGSQLACVVLIVTSKKHILSILEAQLSGAKDSSSSLPSLPACVSLANLCALIVYTASTNVDACNSWWHVEVSYRRWHSSFPRAMRGCALHLMGKQQP